MISLTVKAAKSNFFDRPKVTGAVDAAARKGLSRFGAFVRRRAQTSIRKRRAVSEPGSPPSGHVGTLRKLIFFSYDADRKSVVIGPTLLRDGSRVPSLLEYGGDGPAVRTAGGGTRATRYRARPFMGPAFREEAEKAPGLWANSIR